MGVNPLPAVMRISITFKIGQMFDAGNSDVTFAARICYEKSQQGGENPQK